jgi:hypothetical protein
MDPLDDPRSREFYESSIPYDPVAPMSDNQIPIMIFLGIVVVLGLLGLWGYWSGIWTPLP